MGTCFSYLKRRVKVRKRDHSRYCFTPRSFYQRDPETVELQYLVSVDNQNDANIVDSVTAPGEVADINENITCHSKRACSSKKRRVLQRLLSWLESEDDNSACVSLPSESDMMLRMMLSNDNNVTSCEEFKNVIDSGSTDGIGKCNNPNTNFSNVCDIRQVKSETQCYHHVASGAHKSTMKPPLHNNFKNISCSSSKAPSNSNSNTSSVDLEWEPEGHGMASNVVNKSDKIGFYQQQSSEESVEMSLLSSAESLEWDSCEGAGILLDSDTEQLLQEIERLTARALKETGCECDSELDGCNSNAAGSDSCTNR